MSVKDQIAMSENLFEDLISNEYIQKEYKDKIFTEYAENYMTEGVAMKMDKLRVPVTKDIVDAAMNCVDEKNQAKILFANCSIYDAEDLQQKFSKLGEEYADLVDRTRRHDVILSATPEHYLLAEYLKKIGYITSKEEIKTKYDAALELERDKTQKFLKLRVKKV